MKIMRPFNSEAAMISTNAVDEDLPAYVPGNEYNTGDIVVYQFAVWKCADDGVTEAPSRESTKWQIIRWVNSHALFHEGPDTPTTGKGSLVMEFQYGQIMTGVVLLNVQGFDVKITMTTPQDGVVFESIETIVDIGVPDYWEWFYSPYTIKRNFYHLDLPPYFDATLRVEVRGIDENSDVQIGRFVAGLPETIGTTLFGGLSRRRKSFTEMERDIDGRPIPIARRRRQIPLVNFRVNVRATDFDRVIRILEDSSDEPCVFIGTESPTYTESIFFGFYRDYEQTASNYTISTLTLECQGF